MKIIGSCSGGLSCNGGCCRKITVMSDGSEVHGFCDHYERQTGKCLIYEKREEMGFSGCVTFPLISNAMRNGLPSNCGYKLFEE